MRNKSLPNGKHCLQKHYAQTSMGFARRMLWKLQKYLLTFSPLNSPCSPKSLPKGCCWGTEIVWMGNWWSPIGKEKRQKNPSFYQIILFLPKLCCLWCSNAPHTKIPIHNLSEDNVKDTEYIAKLLRATGNIAKMYFCQLAFQQTLVLQFWHIF